MFVNVFVARMALFVIPNVWTIIFAQKIGTFQISWSHKQQFGNSTKAQIWFVNFVQRQNASIFWCFSQSIALNTGGNKVVIQCQFNDAGTNKEMELQSIFEEKFNQWDWLLTSQSSNSLVTNVPNECAFAMLLKPFSKEQALLKAGHSFNLEELWMAMCKVFKERFLDAWAWAFIRCWQIIHATAHCESGNNFEREWQNC